MFRTIVRPSSFAIQSCMNRSMKLSTQVSASMVKELREKSGAPMMDCKKALAADGVNGDMKLAMDWLRAKGIARATNNADRVTMEGLIAVNKHKNGGLTILEVNSETDFVSMNKDFQAFVALVSNTISEQCNKEGPVSIPDLMKAKVTASTTLQDSLGDIISSIRENIVIKRAENVYPTTSDDGNTVGVVASYVHGKVALDTTPEHIEMGKVAAVVKLDATGPGVELSAEAISALLGGEVGRKLSMHVVAASPLYLAPDDVPKDVVERETAIFREQTVDDGKKKPEILERIVQGKVSKRMAELCLISQPHVAVEGSPVIQKYLESLVQGDVKVSLSSFQRWTLGQHQQQA